MASTTFVDGTTRVIASWANDVNTWVYKTIKDSSGNIMQPGDVLQAGVASSGTVGSGSATLGFLPINSSGVAVGQWVPRTGSAASLAVLNGNLGELAVANYAINAGDAPALYQYTGSGVAGVTYPFLSCQSVSITGTVGAYTGTLPINSDIIRLTVDPTSVGTTSVTLTFATTFTPIDGQRVKVEIVSTSSTVGSFNINGAAVTGNNVTPFGATVNSIPGTNQPFYVQYQYTAGAWYLEDYNTIFSAALTGNIKALWGTTLGPFTGSGGAGFLRAAYGLNSVAAGGSYAGAPYAAGFAGSLAYAGTAINNSTSYGIGTTGTSGASTAIGNATATGQSSLALANGKSGLSQSFLVNWASQTALLLTVTSTAATAWWDTNVFGASGTKVSFQALNGVWWYGYLNAAPTGGAGAWTLVFHVTGAAAFAAGNGYTTATTFTMYLISDGQGSVAIGTATTRNKNAVAFNANRQTYTLTGTTTDGTTAVVLTLDGAAVNTGVIPGVSNRLQLETNKAYAVTIKILAKESQTTGGAGQNTSMWVRNFLAVNNGGTITLSANPTTASVVGTDLTTATVAPWNTTWLVAATAPFTIATQTTNGLSVDIGVTGPAAATTVSWVAVLECNETILA